MAYYHPEYDEVLRDARNRLALARRLKELADRDNGLGDAALLVADWKLANSHWQTGARYMRSSQSISYARPTDREDWPLIGAAWLETRVEGRGRR